MKTKVLCIAVLVALAFGWLVYRDPLPFARDRAVFMCETHRAAVPGTSADHEAYYNYVRSPDFIWTILDRNPKYTPLIPQAVNSWHPRIKDGLISNNHVTIDLDRSYQDLLLDLRSDIYAELTYLEGLIAISKSDLSTIRTGFSCLDAAKAQNPLLDILGPVESAVSSAPTEEAKAFLRKALRSAKKGDPLESSTFKASSHERN